ncbi:MAG: hypothetical protein L0332_06780 [Chloroflexi bacterium]|nr:hypothetical protein [Chloroflexota bacterium]
MINENDSQFLATFEGYRLPLGEFNHLAMLRLIFLYLKMHGYQNGVAQVRFWLRRFLEHAGASLAYHETATLFWCQLVNQALEKTPELADFEALLARYPSLANESTIHEHYSPGALMLNAARQRPFPPDRETISIEKYFLPPAEPPAVAETEVTGGQSPKGKKRKDV